MSHVLDKLLYKLDHEFNNKDLIEEALTHRSMGHFNNERLEFLGDAILGLVIANELYLRLPKAREGELSRVRSSLVKKETLAEIGKILELGQFLRLGSGELKSGGYNRSSILADAMEAIFGAVYLDSGFDSAQAVILNVYSEYLSNLSQSNQVKDPKTQLQEFLQSKKMAIPDYCVIDASGKPHDQIFTVECRVVNVAPVNAKGTSRRKAEQMAAQKMLETIDRKI